MSESGQPPRGFSTFRKRVITQIPHPSQLASAQTTPRVEEPAVTFASKAVGASDQHASARDRS